jgi:endoglucanase
MLLSIALLSAVLLSKLPVNKPAQAQNLNYLHTDGNRILDSKGNHVLVTGISWFGLETENYTMHGLWSRSLQSFLDQIVELGFNTIRLPYSNQLFDPSSVPNGINFDLNPDLKGLNGLEIMDKVIAGAGERGLKVILDRHRPDSHAQSELWYTSQYTEERWISDWVMLVKRYSGTDTVIGADLHNEPHGRATWGTDDLATDWRLAAERLGNAILEVNPNLLIIVQGVEQYQGEFYWWGGNLMGVREHPVRLNRPYQLVYSPHTYGPSVYPQTWFSDPSFPDNMPGIWDNHWGYVHKEGLAPIILGEFGGRSVETDKEGVWQRALVSYLRENKISYLYWTLNPNSGDTGGILLDDWQSVDPKKEALLSGYQFPLIGSGQEAGTPAASSASALASPASTASTPAPSTTGVIASATTASPTSRTSATAPLASASPPLAAGLSVRYHTSNQAEQSSDAKPEFIIANHGPAPVRLEELELVYWFTDDPGQTYVFQCDWAQMGCEKVSGKFEALPEGAYAFHIRFLSGAGELLPGQESGEIKLRFNRTDWSAMRQSDDYSFSAATDYVDWKKGALYSSGQLVWGNAPGLSPASTPPAAASPVPATVILPQPALTAPAASLDLPSKPAWGVWTYAALSAGAASILIVAIWFYRKNR